MLPYYEEPGIKIFHADCREVIPLIAADALVTDPPYGIGEARGRNRSRTKLAKAKDYGVSDWDDEPVALEILHMAIARTSSAVIFGGNYYALPPATCWLVWDKDNGANDFADAELAWTNLRGAVRLKRYRWAGMLQQPGKPKESRYHPTQKPLEVMAWAVQRAGGESVLDPFMGSGTTLRAAKDLGREAIGIEISERYCEIAANRLRQQTLF